MKKDCFMDKNCLWSFIKKLIVRVNEDEIFALSAQLAYYLLLSFFPLLMLIMIIVGFSNISTTDTLKYLEGLLPINTYLLIESTVVEVLDGQKGQLLWFSVILSIWSSSSGFAAVIKGLNKAYGIKETRGYIKGTLISILCTIGVVLIIILTLFLVVFGGVIREFLIAKLPFDNIITFAWDILRFAILIFVMIFVFATLYHFAPCKRLKWNDALPGAVTTTLGWIVVSSLFSFYVNNFSNYSRFYGSLGAVIVLMTWLYITSVILLLGGEINAILME